MTAIEETEETTTTGLEIAVIGMAGRFPGAANIAEFWENLKNGVEAVSFLSPQELTLAGADPQLVNLPLYVKGQNLLPGIEQFDGAFFNYTPLEVEVIDPQMRLFHECVWEALEDAGYEPGTYGGRIGLYSGGDSSSFWEMITSLSPVGQTVNRLLIDNLNNKDYLSSRISYKLNLRGPALSVNTACSTSLVAIHLAVQGLLNGECEMALAGGVRVTLMGKHGYLYEEGMIHSPDGHCRAFDVQAAGTQGGDGAAVVVLKTLEEALHDRDHIYAVIKGSAINNDGFRKVGFHAPSVDGQAEAISAALYVAEVEPQSIGYIETHGTGTDLGDTVEIAALKLAFTPPTDEPPYPHHACAIGSVKTNVGHLGSAAGVTGFIKTVLALYHHLIPPSLHFETANPKLDLENSHFYVNTTLQPWFNEDFPLRAGVSSFGIGGTNAHVVLEEAPQLDKENSTPQTRTNHLLLLSARTPTALEKVTVNLKEFLQAHPTTSLPDIAYTLQLGRKRFAVRRALVCASLTEAVQKLTTPNPAIYSAQPADEGRKLVFMFPGLGPQYVHMGWGIYQSEPVFKEEMERCFVILKKQFALDIKAILYPPAGVDSTAATAPLHTIENAQLVMFIIEYALARLFMAWGIKPYAMIGYSFGEYVAACIAGVMKVEDMLRLLVVRGQLIKQLPAGQMLSVPLPVTEVQPLLNRELSMAIDNGVSCVVSGPSAAIAELANQLKSKRVMCTPFASPFAAHSVMLEPILELFKKEVAKMTLQPPQIPYISSVTGTWITVSDACSAEYWARQLRATVCFVQGIRQIIAEATPVFIEMGPGRDMCALVNRELEEKPSLHAVNLLRHRGTQLETSDEAYLLDKVGRLWLYGVQLDWHHYYNNDQPGRVALPSYPFERQRAWKIMEDFTAGKFSFQTPARAGVVVATAEAAPVYQGPQAHGSVWYDRPPLSTPFVPPDGLLQQTLVNIWQRLFGIQQIGIMDDFFELGGDSLKAIHVLSNLHKETNVSIPLQYFFDNPTIHGMVAFRGALETDKKDGQHQFMAISPVEQKEYYAPSSAQKRQYFLQQVDESSIAYNSVVANTIEGNLDIQHLTAIFKTLIARHESLRTSFIEIEDELVQRIHEQVDFEIEYYGAHVRRAPGVCIQEFVRPFLLSQAPLLRVGLVNVAAQEHILIMDMHHIISDGSSIALLIQEFVALYQGQALPPLTLQYKDYTAWQNLTIKEGALAKQRDFWWQEFADEIPVLELPYDFVRPELQKYPGQVQQFGLDALSTERLHTLAASVGATLYMALLAVANIFLAKLSGQETVVVGTPIAGRTHADLERIVGMFVNTLALKNEPLHSLSPREFLKNVKDKTIHAFANQNYQYEELVDHLALDRTSGRNPLFDVLFALQNINSPTVDIPVLKLKPYPFALPMAKFDLYLECIEWENGVLCKLEYCTELFKDETITRFIGYYQEIVTAMINHPDEAIGGIEIIPEKEKEALLKWCNHISTDSGGCQVLQHLFFEQAQRTPEAIAIVGPGLEHTHNHEMLQLSYAYVLQRAAQVAQCLTTQGVLPTSVVALQMERSVEWIIALLGIFYCGAVYLPIATDYPPERVDFILKDSQASLLVTRSWLNTVTAGNQTTPTALDSSDEPAYIIYTSGSTGKPKGVLLPHRTIAHLIAFQHQKTTITFSRVLQFASIGFDVSVQEVFSTLLSGGVLLLAETEKKSDVAWLFAFISRFQAHVLFLPPAFLKYAFSESEFIQQFPACVLHIIAAGEQLVVTPAMRQCLTQQRVFLHNHYGPSETHVVTSLTLDPSATIPEFPGIGRPISQTAIFILDKNHHLLPVGAVGELYIGGKGLALGYINNTLLSAEKFITLPGLLPEPLLLYKSGDLARWTSEGVIQFLGRVDAQVKIRGFRIELGEIENHLLHLDGIKEAVVTVATDEQGEKFLCAYLVTTRELDNRILREFLANDLPHYMIPAYFVRLEHIPLTANGKINRAALPRPQKEVKAAYVAPATDIEKKLAVIWSGLLGVELTTLSVFDNFFELGGHSLKATSMMSKVHKELEVRVELMEIFRAPTIYTLARVIQSLAKESFQAIEPVEEREYYPLASAQKRLYFLQQMEIKSTSYNMPMAIPLGRDIHIPRLESALKDLVARHEGLRTSFIVVHDEVVQRIHLPGDIHFVIDYFTAQWADVQQLVVNYIQPFDLSQAPLLRSGLIQLPDGLCIWLVDTHHIISDGTSQGILAEDFMQLYKGTTPLTPLYIQYKDFASWHNHLFETGVIDQQRQYWLNTLTGEIPRLHLATDFKRPELFSFVGANYIFPLAKEEVDRLKVLGARFGGTLYMNMMALLNTLFYKYTGQTDIIIGSGVAGRRHADLHGVVGMFINTLPMRNAPDGEKPYDSFLREVIETSVHGFENQDVPFEDLVEKLDPERDPSRNPLFDISMVVQNFRQDGKRFQAELVDHDYLSNLYPVVTSKFDMTVFVTELEDAVQIRMEYYTAIFKEETMQRMAAHIKNIMQVIINHPTITLKDIEMLSQAEKEQLVQQFNQTCQPYPEHKTIYDLFAEQVERQPDVVALVYADEYLTYRELEHQSTILAAYLVQEKGLNTGAPVGLWLAPCLYRPVAVLGILKAGGAFVPLDPLIPLERLEYMIQDACMNLVITQNDHLADIKQMQGEMATFPEVVWVDDLVQQPGWHKRETGSYSASVLASDAAYIIYTSGTTGRPKGTLVEHRGIVNLHSLYAQHFAITSNDHIIQFANIAFDASVSETFMALLNGAALFLVEVAVINDYELFQHYLLARQITVATLPPPYAQHLDVTALASLRILLTAGSAAQLDFIKTCLEQGGFQYINAYGPTEYSICATWWNATADPHPDLVTIGKPIANTAIFIVNDYWQLQPLGVAGELCMAGAGLARGYLNNPELTAQQFITSKTLGINALPACVGERVYRSGDLARWLDDGNIEFLGRIDQQVKIRGFRIEPGEIEARLLKHEAIAQAVVVDRKENNDLYLCAYLVLRPGAQVDNHQLNTYLSLYMPAYMIPSYFVHLAKLPLNASGKVDRKRLPSPTTTTSVFITAENRIEAQLLQIWSSVLGIPGFQISMNANFFELGGHSLKATLLVSKIHKEMKIKVPLAEIFKHPTLQGLAQYISTSGVAGVRFLAIEPVEQREYYPLSSAQKRLYFLQQLDVQSTSYNMPLNLPIGTGINQEKLTNTLKRLMERHESLRTAFITVDEQVVQRIFPLSEISWALDYIEAQAHDIHQLLRSYVRPFDLAVAPLIRSGLVKLPDASYIWMVDLHHIISDGTSQTVLVEDFVQLYQSDLALPPLRIQYKEFACWHNHLFTTGDITLQWDYWLHLLAGDMPRLNLATDYKRPDIFTFAGDYYQFALERETALRFKTLGTRYGSTIYMNMLTLLNALFYKYTGQTDIIIGTGVAGRRHVDLQSVVGMFVNTLVMRNHPQPTLSYDAFLRQVIETSIKGFENQDVQFEELVEKLSTERDPSRNPLYDVSMVVQNFRQVSAAGQAQIFTPQQLDMEYENKTAKFDLTFFISESLEDIFISIEYYTGIFKRETIQRMAVHVQNMIAAVIANPACLIQDIDYLSNSEKEQLLFQFNQTEASFNTQQTIHGLFKEQVERLPDAVAVVFQDLCLTYQEVAQQANRLAYYLRQQKGVQPGEPVGLWMSTSAYRPVAVLGILKAGCAFVPLDPAIPLERIKTIIQDAQIGMVISQKRHIRDLNLLQWECESFHSFLCVDTRHIYQEDEAEFNQLMDQELWQHVGESATDEITGGGWLSSYTGLPFSPQEMDEYGDNTLKKVLPLLQPTMRVLEIGCASGITMFRIVPHVGFYYGTDLSAVIIKKNKQYVAEKGYTTIQLENLAAHDIDQITSAPFDLIIINSVIQCFHGLNYLRKVLQKAIALLADNGYLFIGDVMDLEKKGALVSELRQFKERNRHQGYSTKTDFSAELFVAQPYWENLAAQWPEIQQVHCSQKIHTIPNELTRFRYDVLLTIQKNRPAGLQASFPASRQHKFQEDWSALAQVTAREQATPVFAHDPAYIIYTSGTTGKPKGICVEHKGIINLNILYQEHFAITRSDRVLQFANIAFDASVSETCMALLNGAALCLVDSATINDYELFSHFLWRYHITIATLPPPYAQHLEPQVFKYLRILLTAGSPAAWDFVLSRRLSTSCQYVNAYGPTEYSVCATWWNASLDRHTQLVSIGRPIANTAIFIVDAYLGLLPIGVAGELLISGAGLARGYLNNPELTHQQFIDSLKLPVMALPATATDRCYRSGDLARWLADGNIEFLGRIDQQVKIRGFRIELGEIEACLSKHDDVAQAVVIDRRENKDLYLCAYIVPHPLVELDTATLNTYLTRYLPAYMIPAYYVQIEQIPLSTSGKVNRQALPAPQLSTPQDHQTPTNTIETQLIAIWSHVLGINPGKISVTANFFALGGHSLKATLLVSRIHKEMHVKVPLAEIFKAQTLRQLAEYISGLKEEFFSRIEPAEKREYYAVSSAQRRFYILQQMEPTSIAYNNSSRMILAGPFQQQSFDRAFLDLLARHDSLRSSFFLVNGEPVQQIHLTIPSAIEYFDCTTPGTAQSVEQISHQFERPFDLSQPPLVRVGLIRLESEKTVLMLSIHHIISDGTSMVTFTNEWIHLYLHRELSPLRIQYHDFTQWQQTLLASGKLKTQEEYWLKLFAGDLPVLTMPTDFPRPAVQSFAGDSIYFQLEAQTVELLKAALVQTQTTLYIFLLSVYSIVLHKFSGQSDIIIGSPIAGRYHADLEGIIGLLIETLVRRVFPGEHKTFNQLLEEVRIDTLNAYDNQMYPFGELLKHVASQWDGSRNPLFDTMFSVQNYTMDYQLQLLEGITLHPFESGTEEGVAKVDITLEVVERADDILFHLEYCTALYKKETMEAFIQSFKTVLAAVLGNRDMVIRDITLGHQLKTAASSIYDETEIDF